MIGTALFVLVAWLLFNVMVVAFFTYPVMRDRLAVPLAGPALPQWFLAERLEECSRPALQVRRPSLRSGNLGRTSRHPHLPRRAAGS
jgi:hypothetical protein